MIRQILGDSASQGDEELEKMCKEVAATMYVGAWSDEPSYKCLGTHRSFFIHPAGADTVSRLRYSYRYHWQMMLMNLSSRMP